MSWVLVTGASSGLGLEFCNQLAGRGHNVVMVARRENVLLEQAQRIEDFYGGNLRSAARRFSFADRLKSGGAAFSFPRASDFIVS